MNVPLLLALAVAAVAQVALPLAAGRWARARLRTSWRPFLFGAAVFAIAQLAVRLPLLNWMRPGFRADGSGMEQALLWAVWVAASLALVEQAGRYLGYRAFLRRGLRRNWANAVMYGLGHGALESIFLFGIPTLIALVNAAVLPQVSPTALGLSWSETRWVIATQRQIALMEPWPPLTQALERALVLVVQAGLAVLVLQVFLRASWRWLGYALGLHFVVGLAPALSAGRFGEAATLAVLAATAAVTGYWALRLRPLPPLSPAASATARGGRHREWRGRRRSG